MVKGEKMCGQVLAIAELQDLVYAADGVALLPQHVNVPCNEVAHRGHTFVLVCVPRPRIVIVVEERVSSRLPGILLQRHKHLKRFSIGSWFCSCCQLLILCVHSLM